MWENEADIIYLLHGFLESSVYQNEWFYYEIYVIICIFLYFILKVVIYVELLDKTRVTPQSMLF